MTFHVDLQRRFRNLTAAELEEPELLALRGGALLRSDGWAELLRAPRVVVLAEAGSGKTHEMREQAARLRAEGGFAFFFALEDLDRNGLPGALPDPEDRAFAAWLADNSAPAWFFLDSVDELKLVRGKLLRVLQSFAKSVRGALHRAHVVVSCRPTDWRPVQDLAAVREALPLVPPQPTSATTAAPAPDPTFAPTLDDTEEVARSEGGGAPPPGGIRTVVMLPLDERQIAAFARSLGMADVGAFLAEIGKRDAWMFARRPFDLIALLEVWAAVGELGTRERQHEANVAAKLKDGAERADRGALPDALARSGAERLALALALDRKRTIRSPEQAHDPERSAGTDGALDPATVLLDWTEEQRQALLRRALFDPATYGRVRFHHRSVQEYLAARRLAALRGNGMPARALLRLLFAERYGVRVAIPSMRAVAAWLALADEDVRRELVAVEPEALLSHGDPEALPVAARADLLRAVAAAYRNGGFSGLNVSVGDARRIAHPELAGAVRTIWEGGATEDVRELLLEMVWQGGIEACADIAEAAVGDPGLPERHRATGFRALVACGRGGAARRIAASMVAEPGGWPEGLPVELAPELFPAFLSVAELMALVERSREPKDGLTGFGWFLREIAEDIDPGSGLAADLRTALAELLWRGRLERQDWHRITGRFDHVAPALAILCARRIARDVERGGGAHPDPGLVRASVLAHRFGHDRSERVVETDGRLRRSFERDAALRAAAFWVELAIMDEVVPSDEDWDRFFHTHHGGLVEPLGEADRGWLETTLADTAAPSRRAVALQVLLQLWTRRGRAEAEGEALRHAVADDERLSAEAVRRTIPPAPNAALERMARDDRRIQAVHNGREQRRRDGWQAWRDAVVADPEAAFRPETLPTTTAALYDWLSRRPAGRRRFGVWDAATLEAEFGSEVARRAAEAFRAVWRTGPPVLWSRRSADERGTTPLAWAQGLCGLAVEAAALGWASRLGSAEARAAAAFATVELNGFPPWMADLATARPAEVAEVLGGELDAQLAMAANHPHLPLLQNLARADRALKAALAPRLAVAVAMFPSPLPTEQSGENAARHLDDALRLLDETTEGEEDRRAAAAVYRTRYLDDVEAVTAPAWLRGLFRFDAAAGVDALEAGLASPGLADAAQAGRGVAAFAAVFGDRDTEPLRDVPSSRRPALLGRLLRCAYRWVRREDDVRHEGAYYVGPRDRAETARNALLSALLGAPGPEVHGELLALADDPLFAHLAPRLRWWARRRASADSEPPPLDAADMAALEERHEAPPRDRDGLFDAMRGRLDDLQHDVAHDDFTIRRTLRRMDTEDEVQRWVAGRLRDAARGAYTLEREGEVADRKRTDIRLAARRGNAQKAVVEVKIADKGWTVGDLERALRAQLVGQYLRDRACRAGCLLLVWTGAERRWRCPDSGGWLRFAEVVERLAGVAREIETESAWGVRVAVHGLDLTDPKLPPAHR